MKIDKIDSISELAGFDKLLLDSSLSHQDFSKDKVLRKNNSFKDFKTSRTFVNSSKYQVSKKEENGLKGEIYRCKGFWRKVWALEYFIIQCNLFITYTKEAPYSIKLCVPFQNVISIQIEDNGIIIKYTHLQRGRHVREAYVKLREARDSLKTLFDQLNYFWFKAKKSKTMFLQYIDRYEAVNKIDALYDLFKTTSIDNFFWKLEMFLQKQSYDRLKLALQSLRQLAQENIKKTQRFQNMKRFSLVFVKTLHFYLHQIFFLYQENLNLIQSTRLKEEAKTSFTNMLVNHTESIAEKKYLLFETRVTQVFKVLHLRFMRSSFSHLKFVHHLNQNSKLVAKTTLKCFLLKKATSKLMTMKQVLYLWKHSSYVSTMRIDVLKRLIKTRCTTRHFSILYQWRNLTHTAHCRLQFAFQQLTSFVQHYNTSNVQMALHLLGRYALQKQQLKQLVSISNVVQVNDTLLKKCNTFFKEKSCYQLTFVLRKLCRVQILLFFRCFYNVNPSQRRRNICYGILSLEHAQLRFLRHGFEMLRQASRQFNETKLKKYLATTQFLNKMDEIIQRNLSQYFCCWKQKKIHNVLYTKIQTISRVMYRCQLRQYTISFGMLSRNALEKSMIRGLLRVRHLEKFSQYCERYCLISMTKMFMQWKNWSRSKREYPTSYLPQWVQQNYSQVKPFNTQSNRISSICYNQTTRVPHKTTLTFAVYPELQQIPSNFRLSQPHTARKIATKESITPKVVWKRNFNDSVETILNYAPYRPEYKSLAFLHSANGQIVNPGF
ncbi:uncharacterized protein LOC128883707 isoform X2 [Hylaeus volcanicus]|uniref:uncharacterized protein LOC128883707 isoform X2 n=1 Tax=Hylaeus volcanicus TaxID=313075 RepID=UPI0023B850B8|nr:uncharacterized protein LOC128883707 isoform X2 [Hylaeus volcanicus]